MQSFAERTGLADHHVPPRRYLWTDAFAACNDLELARATELPLHVDRARALVDQVHRTLGRHRADDARTGWISGLSEVEGARHPTLGGLRIGKPLPERGPHEPLDERREWDRDGQYFHYLTKWIGALVRLSEATGDDRPLRWATELARTAHDAFTYTQPRTNHRRMHWKLSIDLSRPLVESMGQHDPLDGWLTALELVGALGPGADSEALRKDAADFAALASEADWVTTDALGIGGLLSDAPRAARLHFAGELDATLVLERLLHSAAVGLGALLRADPFHGPAEHRLAFRELGLSIGLHAVSRTRALVARDAMRFEGRGTIGKLLESLEGVGALALRIEDYWLRPEHRTTRSWLDHEDINAVMLATSLVPIGYLAA